MGLVLMGCATYQSQVSEQRRLIERGQVQEALLRLEPLAQQEGDNQLIYLLDYATALQMAGEYKKSNEYFLKADLLGEKMDYVSISNVALATLGSADMIQYKGESFERILLHMYMALNFLMLGDTDSAQVAVRRVNERINKIRQETRNTYELNPFAHYLSSLIWESEGNFDNAYIAAEKAYEIDGATNPFLPSDLIRLARKARRPEAEKKWREQFDREIKPEDLDRKRGELVFVFQQGWGPRKGFSPGSYRFPKLYPTRSLIHSVRLQVDESTEATSEVVYDVERVAIKTLDDDYGWLVAQRIGAMVAKDVVADQIRQKNELAGALASLAMHLSDRADLRQWSFLPETFQMLRLNLKPGKYRLSGQALSTDGVTAIEPVPEMEFEIRSGKKTFLTWRSVK